MMRPKIKFVRTYNRHKIDWIDIVYHSGRCVTCLRSASPKTAEKFIAAATVRKEQYDNVFKHAETIYEA